MKARLCYILLVVICFCLSPAYAQKTIEMPIGQVIRSEVGRVEAKIDGIAEMIRSFKEDAAKDRAQMRDEAAKDRALIREAIKQNTDQLRSLEKTVSDQWTWFYRTLIWGLFAIVVSVFGSLWGVARLLRHHLGNLNAMVPATGIMLAQQGAATAEAQERGKRLEEQIGRLVKIREAGGDLKERLKRMAFAPDEDEG